MINKIHTITYSFIAIVFGLFIPSTKAYGAVEYIPLSSGLPGSMGNEWKVDSMGELLNLVFGVSVAIAAILAVIMLAIGGFKYMTTDSVFAIGGAKEQITNAIVGLLIVLTAILILSTINPGIVEFSLFKTDS